MDDNQRARRGGKLRHVAVVAMWLAGTSWSQEIDVGVAGMPAPLLNAVASDGTGYKVTYAGLAPQGGCTSVWLRGMDETGRFTVGPHRVPMTCEESAYQSQLACVPTGECAVVWYSHRMVGNWPEELALLRIFGPDGVPVTGAMTLAVWGDSHDIFYEDFRIVAHPAGKFLVTWNRYETDPGQPWVVGGATYGLDGAFQDYWGVSDPFLDLTTARAAVLGSGDIVMTWASCRRFSNGPYTLHGQVYDGSLVPRGAAVLLSPEPDALAGAVTGAGDDEVVAAWVRARPDGTTLLAQRYDASLTPVGDKVVVNDSEDLAAPAAIRVTLDGRALVTWDLAWPTTRSRGKWLDAEGRAGPEFSLGMTDVYQQIRGIATLGEAHMLVGYASALPVAGAIVRRFVSPVSLAIAPGDGPVNPAWVGTSRPDGVPRTGPFTAYGVPGHGANVGAGDLEGDDRSEILTGPGPSPSYGPHVRAFRGDGSAVSRVSFYAYATLRYGVQANGLGWILDPADELLTTPGPGDLFGPHVRAFTSAPVVAIPSVSFFAYGTLRYGCHAARGNLLEDPDDEILTTPGPGFAFAPTVRAFDGVATGVRPIPEVQFDAFPDGRHGATIAAADVESDGHGGFGDGYDEILAGRGPDPGFPAAFAIFDYDGVAVTKKWDHPASLGSAYGIHVAGGDVDAGDAEEVVLSPGPDPAAPMRVVCWEWSPWAPELLKLGADDFVAFSSFQLPFGANVAVGAFE